MNLTGEMPRRPSGHVTEDESELAFRRALPSEWIYRPLPHDYGIDGEVEIVRGELVTGQLFKVQLKGTVQNSESEVRKVRIPHRTANYYAALGLPILICRHHQPSERLWVRWFHSFDPHYGGRNEKSITLTFEDEDEWNEETPATLVADVQTFYRLRNPAKSLPLQLVVDPEVLGGKANAFLLTLRGMAREHRNVLTLKMSDDEDVDGWVSLTSDRISVTFRGVASATIHHDRASFDGDNLTALSNDVFICLALALDQVGLTDAAARLGHVHADGANVVKNPDVLMRLIGCFARARRIAEALQLAERMPTSSQYESELLAALFQIPALIYGRSMTDAEKHASVDFLRKRLSRAKKNGRESDIGTAHYNLANRLRLLAGHQQEVVSNYKSAMQWNPEYLERSYFFREYGGALFEVGEFAEAARMYEEALQRGEGGMTRALWADSLMGAGEYRKARDVFRTYNSEHSNGEEEWRLKERVLEHVLTIVGDRQQRQVDEAMRLADVSDPDLSDERRLEMLTDALKVDGLCTGAWFNLGILHGSRLDIDRSFECFINAAVIARSDTTAWVTACLASINSSDEDLFRDIVRCAHKFNKQAFLRELSTAVAQMDASYPGEDLLARATAAIAEAPSRPEPVELRFLEPGGGYQTMRIDGLDT